MDTNAKQGILFSQNNWINLTAGTVIAGAQQSAGAYVGNLGQATCYVHFVLGAINVGGGGYLRYYFQFSNDGTTWYEEEAVRSIGGTGELTTVEAYRELTANYDRRIAFPLLDDWVRVGKIAVDGGGDFLTTVFTVHLRAG